jgi:hypothetical protein
MPFDEDPEEPVHIRIRKRLDHAFDSDLLFDIGISEAGQYRKSCRDLFSHKLNNIFHIPQESTSSLGSSNEILPRE